MFYGIRHIEVGKSSFGRTISFKDENGERKEIVGLSFEEAQKVANDLTG